MADSKKSKKVTPPSPAPQRGKKAAALTPELASAAPSAMRCPACGAAQTAPMVTVLRPGDAALAQLFRGALNLFICPACDTRFRLDAPILYRDDAARQVVYYVPQPEMIDVAEAEGQVQAILDACFGDAPGEMPECRLALSHQELIEKIALARAALNDRLVEFIKYQLYLKHEDELDPRHRSLFYDFSNTDPDKLAFILFDCASGKGTAATHVPMEVYRELEEAWAFSPEMKDEIVRLFPGFRACARDGFV